MFAAEHIPYAETNAFTRIILDYLKQAEGLKPFYSEPATVEGVKSTLKKKQHQPIERKLLVEVLQKQYQIVQANEQVTKNIASLLSENTFTICTAHQPNLFTGPLYFIYKILHTIRLAAHLKEVLPSYNFVPVYYMGSEDADFAELNHTYVDGKKIEWRKEQKGAVGRMLVDQTLVQLINELEGQLSGEPYGKEVITLLRKSYSTGKDIQSATFELVHELYGAFGLVVLIPDHPAMKAQMKKVFEEDLFENYPFAIVQKTSDQLAREYNAQAHPREINLFYLKDDIRERIEKKKDHFIVCNTGLHFTESELRMELDEHPERFSPNVILRGLFQETILPNLVFIGGGGELAYWLQLKSLFEHYDVVYPVLVLRNSFVVVEKKWQERTSKLDFRISDLFRGEEELVRLIVSRNSQHPVSLNGNFEKAEALFQQIKSQAETIDQTLSRHVEAIKARSLKTLQELEKKMYRAEKRKFSDQQAQIQKIREALFPKNGLQERVENFSSFYSKWGRLFIDALYQNSLSLEQEFTILMEQPAH
jgi:bacillithiol biosynthesis cysteine-adding enzyme BshC